MSNSEVWLFIPNGAEWEDIKIFATKQLAMKHAIRSVLRIAESYRRKGDNLLTFKAMSYFHIERAVSTEDTDGELVFVDDETYVLDYYALSANDTNVIYDTVVKALDDNNCEVLFMNLHDLVEDGDE